MLKLRSQTKWMALIALLSSMPTHAAHFHTKKPGVLTVIAYEKFAPISYGLCGAGYEGDLLRSIAKLWDVKITFYPESIYDGLWLLPSKDYTNADISMGGITPSQYRIKQGALFSIGTTSFSQSLLIRKQDYESGKIVSYNSFKNNHLKIGVVPGTTGALYAHLRAKEQNLPSDIFIPYRSESELLPALIQGKIDAIARGEIGNIYQESKHPTLLTIAKKNFGEKFSFAIDSRNPELANRLNQAIQKVTNHGKIDYSAWVKNNHVFQERVTQMLENSDVY